MKADPRLSQGWSSRRLLVCRLCGKFSGLVLPGATMVRAEIGQLFITGDAEKATATKDKRLEDMRSRYEDVVHPAVKRKRKIVGRAASSVKAFRIVHAAMHQCTDLVVYYSVQTTVIYMKMLRPRRQIAFLVSAPVFAQTAAQLWHLVSNISLEQLNSQELLTSFKTNFNERMQSLDLSVKDLCVSHILMVNKWCRQDLDLLTRGDKVKADLSLELTSTRLLKIDAVRTSSSEVNSSLSSLSSQLAEIVAHLKRAGDAKNGEASSSSRKRGM
ncbi:hypothetical protein F511_27917 [Dorcoceras hygrometricum]|uniref:Uncharacterized protein n=1 Tax=Dorcoceras hygrometricum TaxID=472368 RepID=A0A2Z7CP91_9LAMI|nr:hypothetical protein F511_27917 [Dorcoceras hygrometricum]